MNWFRGLYNKVKDSILQDCPSDIYACEICDDLDCTNEKWLSCPIRLDAAEFMEAFKKIPVTDFVCEYQKAKLASPETDPDLDTETI
jgi:hypothetical protein